jgi:hypothetical protein
MSNPQQNDTQARVQLYRQLVQDYEALDKEIDALIMRYGGASKNMPSDVLTTYRKMARRRSNLRNDMRILEEYLFDDD